MDERGRLVGHVGELTHTAYGLIPVRTSFGAELYLPMPSPGPSEKSRVARRDARSFDISLLVGADTRASAAERVIADALGADLISAQLIDIYADTSTTEHHRSLTFRVVYAASRGEPREVWEEMASLMHRTLDAQVRGSAT